MRAERGLGVGPAHGVVDHVDAAPLGDDLDALAQVLGRVIDAVVGAVLSANGPLLIGRAECDDLRTKCFAYLDRSEADATGSAEHEQPLAALQGAAIAQRMVG